MQQETSFKLKAIRLLGLFASFSLLLSIFAILQIFLSFILLLAHLRNEDGVSEMIFHFPEVIINGEVFSIWHLPEFYISLIITGVLMIAISIGFIALIINKNPVKYLGFKKFRKSDYKWIAFSLLFIAIYGLILFILNLDLSPDITFQNNFQIFLAVLGVGIYGPVFEEILFRGYMLTRLNEILGNKKQYISVFIVSVLFAMLHIYYPMQVWFLIFLMSVFLCVMKLRTGNLWLPVIFHVINNLLAVYLLI